MNDLILLAIVSELEKAEDIPATAKRLGFRSYAYDVALHAGFPVPGDPDDDRSQLWHNTEWRLLGAPNRRFYGSSDLINFWSADGVRAPEKGLLLCLYQKRADLRWQLDEPLWLLGLAHD